MEEKKVKLLIINDNEGRVDLIRRHLSNTIYSIAFEVDWENGLEKVKAIEYNLIILNDRLENEKNDAAWFLKQLENDAPEKLEIPFLVSAAANYDVGKIENILKGKRFKFIDKDKDNETYRCEMEWAIINLVPRVFYIYREKIKDALSLGKKHQGKIGDLRKKIESSNKNNNVAIDSFSQINKELSYKVDENKREIEGIQKDQVEIKDKYVQWKDIIQTLSILVAVFTLAMGLILSIIMLFFDQPIEVNVCGEKLLPVLTFSGFVLAIWGFIPYFLFKRSVNKIIENRAKRIIENSAKEIIEKQLSEHQNKRKERK